MSQRLPEKPYCDVCRTLHWPEPGRCDLRFIRAYQLEAALRAYLAVLPEGSRVYALSTKFGSTIKVHGAGGELQDLLALSALSAKAQEVFSFET